jgi:predicted Zn-dependent protease
VCRIMALLLGLAFALLRPATAGECAKELVFTEVDAAFLKEVEAFDRQLDSRGMVQRDAELEQYLETLAKPLLPERAPERVTWKFRIARDPMVNAFALPTGAIYVTTGLLALLENDQQLAGILAHEISHVTNRHGYCGNRDRRKKSLIVNLASGAAMSGGAGIGGVGGIASMLGGQLVSFAAVAAIFGYSRELEKEADLMAVGAIKKSGGDPTQLVRSFQLLGEKTEVEPLETFYRDHPKLEERIVYTSALIGVPRPEQTTVGASTKTDLQYLERMAKVIRTNVRLDMDIRRQRTAVARATRLVEAFPNDPESLTVLADAYRALGPRTATPDASELTKNGRRKVIDRLVKKTGDEEYKLLMTAPGGHDRLNSNSTRAEELYKKALDIDSQAVAASRGLGMLYEEQGKAKQALFQ